MDLATRLMLEAFGGGPNEFFVLAPPLAGELESALAELRSAPLLDGHRGRPPVDRAALARIVDAVGRLLVED